MAHQRGVRRQLEAAKQRRVREEERAKEAQRRYDALRQELSELSDAQIIAKLKSVPALADEDDPVWSGTRKSIGAPQLKFTLRYPRFLQEGACGRQYACSSNALATAILARSCEGSGIVWKQSYPLIGPTWRTFALIWRVRLAREPGSGRSVSLQSSMMPERNRSLNAR